MKSTLTVLMALLACSFCGQASYSMDSTTEMCIDAYQVYSLNKDKLKTYEQHQPVSISGLAGNTDTFAAQMSITGSLTFSGTVIEGQYSYHDMDNSIIHIKGFADISGNLYLEEITAPGWINYVFKGRIKDNEILGLWTKGNEKKQFAFYAKIQ